MPDGIHLRPTLIFRMLLNSLLAAGNPTSHSTNVITMPDETANAETQLVLRQADSFSDSSSDSSRRALQRRQRGSKQQSPNILIRPTYPFPKPEEYNLSGPFEGIGISRYLRYFERACSQYGLVPSLANHPAATGVLVRYFSTWCSDDVAEVVWRKVNEKDGSCECHTWAEFVRWAKRHWVAPDPDQDSRKRVTKLEKWYARKIEPVTAMGIMNALYKLDSLLARIPDEDAREVATRDAPRMFLNHKLSRRAASAICARGFKFSGEAEKMEFDEFLQWIMKILEDGFELEGRFICLQDEQSDLETEDDKD